MGQVSPNKWLSRIDRSLKFQKDAKDEAARFLRAYAGDYSKSGKVKDVEADRDLAIINYVYAYVETVGPSIFFGEPRILVEGRKPRFEDSARKMAGTVNYFFRELGAKKHFARCRFDRFFSHAGILTDWEFDAIDKEMDEPYVAYVNPITGEPVMGTRKIKVPFPVSDKPILRRVNPWDIILDPDSECREEDRFRGLRQVVTYASFIESKEIPKNIKDKIKPVMRPNDVSRQPHDEDEHAGDSEWVVLYKIWDWENKEVLLIPDKVAEEKVDFLYRKKWMYEMEYENDPFPLTILESKRDDRNPYGFSEFKAFWPQIEEQNRISTTIQAHTRRQAPGWLSKKGSNTEEQLEKVAQMRIGEIAQVNDPNAIIPKPLPPLPADTYNHRNVIRDDLDNVSGFWGYAGDSIADTATESSLLEKRASLRKDASAQEFEEFVAIVGGKLGALLQQFLTDEIAIKVQKPDNPRELEWLEVTGDEIAGEYNYTIRPGIMQHRNEAVRRQQILKFAEIMGQNEHVNKRWLAERVAEAYEFDPQEALLTPQEMSANSANLLPKDPPLSFDKIDPAALPAEIRKQIVDAALQQNGVAPAMAAPEAPGSSIGSEDPQIESVMSEMNENTTAPINGEVLPPPNPIQPFSEINGGPSDGGL